MTSSSATAPGATDDPRRRPVRRARRRRPAAGGAGLARPAGAGRSRPCPGAGAAVHADLSASRRRLLLAVLQALAGALLARWPVGVLLGALLGGFGPQLFGAGAGRKRAIARVEAVAVWTEMLRDMMAAASGLEEAIIATARTGVVPEPIRRVTALASRLQGRWPFRAALQAFGDELADPSADKVVVALALAREQRVRQLGEMLSALARSTREQVGMRLRVDTERARRASARFITLFSLAMVGLLLVFSRGYLEPFGGLRPAGAAAGRRGVRRRLLVDAGDAARARARAAAPVGHHPAGQGAGR